MKPRRLRRKPRRQRQKQWKKKQRQSREWGRGRERGRRIREPWRRVMRWTSSAARSGNRIRRCSATPGKRSGSTRKFVAETMTKKKPFFERGSATLRKPRFGPIYYPDRKRGEKRINVPAKWTNVPLLSKCSCCNDHTHRERHASLLFFHAGILETRYSTLSRPIYTQHVALCMTWMLITGSNSLRGYTQAMFGPFRIWVAFRTYFFLFLPAPLERKDPYILQNIQIIFNRFE